ncbi:histone deacetylase [Candidatus Pelagibacter sp. Uisw_092]|uniref:histone deacetylase family protein n=1 Tax=Candidatus Pelagibacter sp. Uisw_092 TaxID=3230979 RepID=UPI0039EC181C
MELPVVNHESYVAKIGDDHKFPINKFGELAKYLINKKIVKKFHKPYPCSFETLNKAHSKNYINNIKNKTLDESGVKKIGFPLVDSVVQRSLVATGGTVLAAKLALNFGIACNTAGGSHHANYDSGAGYCVFNDVAVAAHYLLDRGFANRILIVDLDVHQGNGNSEIFKDNKHVFTFSMHSKTNYPAKKSISDLDIELQDNLEDDAYIKTLKFYLNELNNENFDFVFYIAGVDIHFNDRLGKLKISDEGIKKEMN